MRCECVQMQMHTLSQVIVQDLTDTKTPEDREDTRTVALIHTHIILHLCMCMHTWTPVATQHLKSDQSTHWTNSQVADLI
jgi:hypothetical protein